MTILVTGATGFIGRHLTKRLLAEGDLIRVVTRDPGRLPPEWSSRVEVVTGDLRDRAIQEAATKGATVLFNLAGETRDMALMRAVNVEAVKGLLEAAVAAGVKRVVHLSSVGVIGRTKQRVVDEDTPCNPMNLYERTKWEAEQIVMEDRETCRSVILRPTNVFSEETIDLDSYRGMRSAIKIWLNGNERSHLVYVSDVVEAGIYLLQNSTDQGCQIFIVSSDEEPGGTNSEVYDTVRRLLQHKVTKRKLSFPLWLTHDLKLLRHGYANRGDVCYSSRRLLSTGFKMPFGLFEGIRRAVEITLHA